MTMEKTGLNYKIIFLKRSTIRINTLISDIKCESCNYVLFL